MNDRKTAVITGGSSGLGAALIDAFRNRNYNVVNVSRSNAHNADFSIAADLATAEGRAAAAGEITARFGRIDMLI